jgi:predicted HD phosphohydrolase
MFNEALSKEIYAKHFSQSIEDVINLREFYRKNTIFGVVKVSDLFLKLKDSFDITDRILYATNQYDHALQTYEMMLMDDVCDEELLLAALIHDIGKVVPSEKPENLFCANKSMNSLNQDSPQIEDLTFHFGHDEIAYIKLKDHCPEKVSFIIRYHSSRFSKDETQLLRLHDRENFELLEQFLYYDLKSKDPEYKPDLNESTLIELIDRFFPEPIHF